jgi:hypothetical protein
MKTRLEAWCVGVWFFAAGCRGPEFQLAVGVDLPESCEPEPDHRVGEDCGVFVLAGADGDGTLQRPFGSLEEALEVGGRIYVCGERFTGALVIADDVTLHGGLSCESFTWDLSARTELTAPAGVAPLVVRSPATLVASGLRVVAASAIEPSSSSIALIAEDGADLTLERVDLVAADGADGLEGAEGSAGENGASGNPGSATLGGTGGTSACEVAGGKGGNPGSSAASNGSSGQPLAQANGGAAGCVIGGSGDNAASGADAEPIDELGTLSVEGYVAPLGAAGEPGSPGGGAGGGGGIPGAGGGGGGAGGCGGAGGLPGGSGGASFAVVSTGAIIRFFDATASVGRGGRGARGGVGGDSGAPGTGAAGHGAACAGGVGGVGGDGGRGAAGAGGHAAIVAFTGAEIPLDGLSFEPPTAAQAGESDGGLPGLAAETVEI